MSFKSLRVTLALLLPLLWVEGVWAVDCTSRSYDPDSGYTLEPPGCDRIPNNLRQTNDSVTNVDYLGNITSIGGYLFISGNALTNLDGLASLTSVGSYLVIGGNNRLTNLDGLANFTNVGAALGISNNDALTNLDGLVNVTNIGGYLSVDFNDALTNIAGLANITSVGGYLEINADPSLSNCPGAATVLGWPNGPPHDGVGGDIYIGTVGPVKYHYSNHRRRPDCPWVLLNPSITLLFSDKPRRKRKTM